MENILDTITAYREERKWSLYDLATHAELKPSTISTWYNKNRLGGKSRFSGVSRLFCYYRVNSSVFSGL